MDREGKCPIAPDPALQTMTHQEIAAIIDGVVAMDRYGSRKDIWGKGMIGGKPCVPLALLHLSKRVRGAVAGKVGEYATWKSAQDKFPGYQFPEVDFTRRLRGDGGIDLVLAGVKCQIKTRVSVDTNLVRVYGDVRPGRRGPIALAGMAHVFCSWHRNDEGFARVLGWIRTDDMRGFPIEDGVGDWKNMVIPDEALLPMDRLWDMLEIRIHP